MQCEEVRNRLADYLRGELPNASMAEVRQHAGSCSECREEIRELEELWAGLSEIRSAPAHSRSMRARFEESLDGYRESLGARPTASPARRNAGTGNIWRWSLILQAAGAAALVILGILIGRFGLAPAPPRPSELGEVHRELHDLREMFALSLMQQQSASERLRGVSWSNQIDRPGSQVVSALLDALTHDPNVNVRLAAVDALRRFSDQEIVRRRTVQTLAETPFPMLQVALIDFIVETRDTSAVGALRKPSSDPAVNESVRSRARWGIERLSS